MPVMPTGIIDTLVLLAYISVVLIYGLYKGRQVKSYSDYMVAGRNVGAFLLVGTLIMTEFNTASLVGLAAQGYAGGITALWFAFSFIASLGIYTLFFAKKWKRYNGTSLIEMFSERYGQGLGRLATVLMVCAMVGLTSVYLTSASKVFAPAFGWSYLTTVLVITLTVLTFTLWGGLISVIFTDLVSFLVTLVALPVIFIIAISQTGGFAALPQVFQAEFLSLVPSSSHPTVPVTTIFGFMILSISMYQLAPWYAQRMFAAKNEGAALRAMIWATIGVVGLYAINILTSAFARVQWPDLQDADMGLVYAILNWSPVVIKGLLLAAVYAIGQSTMSSIWNTNASLVTENIYKGWFKPAASEQELFKASKIVTLLLALTTIIISYFFISYVLRALVFADVFLMVLIFATVSAFYWWRAGTWSAVSSAVAGIISGALFTFNGVGEFVMILWTVPIIFIVGIATAFIEPPPSGAALARRVRFYDKVGAPFFGKRAYLEAKKMLERRPS